jgi:crotonobetainyl-CoA:carnitine CoA-transferase CaiB-like acyl-CoA transferase
MDARSMEVGPLAGLNVIDLGRVVAAPFVGQVLGDLGASVIKVERPGTGDESRSYTLDATGATSPQFLALNRNKRSVTIDLASDRGKDVLRRLVAQSDVLVHNFRPGVMDRLGFGVEDVRQLNDRLVYCGISGFGITGDLSGKAANDVIAQAYSGLMSFTGEAGGSPVRIPVPLGDYVAGFYAVIGILAALTERNKTGIGRHIETSLIEGMLTLESMQIIDYLISGRLPKRLGSGNMLGQPNQAFPTSDGTVLISTVNDTMWHRCARALGGSELANDGRFLKAGDRLKNRDELVAVIEAKTQQLTTVNCLALLEKAGVVCSPVNTIDAVVHDRQIQHLGIIQRVGRDGEEVNVVGSPLLIDGVRPVPHIAPPARGVDTEMTLKELGYTNAEIKAMVLAGEVEFPSPLDGAPAETK